MIRRREFITLLGGALTSRPIPANAQPGARNAYRLIGPKLIAIQWLR
jgi:hypothetical protein